MDVSKYNQIFSPTIGPSQLASSCIDNHMVETAVIIQNGGEKQVQHMRNKTMKESVVATLWLGHNDDARHSICES